MPETEVIGRAAIHQVEHYVPDEVLLKALLPKSELSEPNMNETGHTLPFYGMRLFNFEGKPETQIHNHSSQWANGYREMCFIRCWI